MLVFIVIAILLRVFAGAEYIRAVISGKAKPHVVSWFFWGLTAMIAFAVQLSQGVGAAAFVTLALGLGPVTVFILALAKGLHKVQFTRADKWCAVLTAVGIGLWLATKDPMAALWLSIVADFISGIPTILKSYKRPHTEHALPYGMSVASMVITLASTRSWTMATVLFPAYILCSNLMFATIIITKLGLRVRQLKRILRNRLLASSKAPLAAED